jgi:hypothetical protein
MKNITTTTMISRVSRANTSEHEQNIKKDVKDGIENEIKDESKVKTTWS